MSNLSLATAPPAAAHLTSHDGAAGHTTLPPCVSQVAPSAGSKRTGLAAGHLEQAQGQVAGMLASDDKEDDEEEAKVPCADMAATQAFGNDDDSGSEPAEPARLVRLDDGGAAGMAVELPDGVNLDVLCLGRERQPAERDGLRVVSVVVSDPLVSRLHAELRVEGGPVARREAAMRDSRPGAPRR